MLFDCRPQAFSDNDSAWEEHKKIAKTLNIKHNKDDGVFWMPYKEFTTKFRNIDFVDRTTGFRDIAFEFTESQGCYGPVLGIYLRSY